MTTDHEKTRVLELLRTAISKRTDDPALGAQTTLRLVHAEADGIPSVTIDSLDGPLLVERHRQEVEIEPVIAGLVKTFGDQKPIFLKERWAGVDAGIQTRQVGGDPFAGAFVARENQIKYHLNLLAGEHIGLFLDARPARNYVRSISRGARILNLFSYTGAFGLAAAAGGARSTTNVDNKHSALQQAKMNYELNDLPFNSRSFLKDDVIKHLKRAAKGRGQYDLVIVDPPPRFARPGRPDYRVGSHYASLVSSCLNVLAPKGRLIAGLNARGVSDEEFEALVLAGAKKGSHPCELEQFVGAGPDFPAGSTRPTARFAVILKGH